MKRRKNLLKTKSLGFLGFITVKAEAFEVLRALKAMWRKLITRRMSSSCFDPPPVVHSRRVVVTGINSQLLYLFLSLIVFMRLMVDMGLKVWAW